MDIRKLVRVLPLLFLIGALPEAPRSAAAAEPPARFRYPVIARIDSASVVEPNGGLLPRIDSLLARAEGTDDRVLVAQLLARSGGIRTSSGRPREGQDALRRAAATALEVGDSSTYCYAIRWLEVGAEMLGRPAEAESLCRELRDMAARTKSPVYAGWAAVGLAWSAYRSGRLEESVALYDDAIARFREAKTARGEAWAENGRGAVLARLGRFRPARASYARAAALARSVGYSTVESYAVNNLGVLDLQLGDPGRGLGSFQRAREIHLDRGNVREAIVPSMNVAYCLRQLGRIAEASAALEATLQTCRAAGYRDLEGSVLCQLASVRTEEGKHHGAMALYRAALASQDALLFKDRIMARVGLAENLAAVDSMDLALGTIREAGRMLERSADVELTLNTQCEEAAILERAGRRRETLVLSLDAAARAAKLRLSGVRVEQLARAAGSALALGRPDSALALYEEAARAWEAERSVPKDPEWRVQRGASSRLLASELGRLLATAVPPATESERIGRAFDRLERLKARTLLERMRGPEGAAPDSAITDSLALPSMRELQSRLLRDGDLLLDVHVGPRLSIAFALTRGGCRWAELPGEATIQTACDLFHDAMLQSLARPAEADPHLFATVRGALGGMLLDPFADLLAGSRRILFCPDGPLNLIPIGLLPPPGAAGRGNPATAAIDRWECVLVPSPGILALQQDGAQAHRGLPGGPDRREGILALAGARNGSGQRLREAAVEVQDLAERFAHVRGVVIREGGSVRAQDLASAPFAVLHVASHVEIDDASPWRSALCLSPDPAEGRILAADVAAMEIPAQLVVLSGCEAARGRVVNGEGVQGLSTAFLISGATSVVASLWPVPDRETAVLMRTFYDGLSAGGTVSQALRRAQLRMRDDPRTANPIYWSGFVSIGGGETRVPLAGRPRPPRGWLMGVVCLALLVTAVRDWPRRPRAAGVIPGRGGRPRSGAPE